MNGKINILSYLKSNSGGFSKTLEKISSYLKVNADKAIFQTITQLAEVTGTSEASIVRFCRHLGYSSYAEFKMSLALAINDTAPAQNGSSSNTVSQRLNSATEGLKHTSELIDTKLLIKVADTIKKSGKVIIIGVASSGVTAEYLNYQLNRIGIISNCFSDMHMACMTASHLDKNDLLFSISSGGSTKEVIEATKIGKQRGCKTIGITNISKSPLLRHLDICLTVANPEAPLSGGDFCAKINQLFLIELIISNLVLKYPDCKKSFADSANAVVNLLY